MNKTRVGRIARTVVGGKNRFLYHGTSDNNFQKIKSKGLLPWLKGGYGQSKSGESYTFIPWTSMYGSYLTNDIKIAHSAAMDAAINNKSAEMVVGVIIDEKKLAADEDMARHGMKQVASEATALLSKDVKTANPHMHSRLANKLIRKMLGVVMLPAKVSDKMERELHDEALELVKLAGMYKICFDVKDYDDIDYPTELHYRKYYVDGVDIDFKKLPDFKKVKAQFLRAFDLFLRRLTPVLRWMFHKGMMTTGRYPGVIGVKGNPRIASMVSSYRTDYNRDAYITIRYNRDSVVTAEIMQKLTRHLQSFVDGDIKVVDNAEFEDAVAAHEKVREIMEDSV